MPARRCPHDAKMAAESAQHRAQKRLQAAETNTLIRELANAADYRHRRACQQLTRRPAASWPPPTEPEDELTGNGGPIVAATGSRRPSPRGGTSYTIRLPRRPSRSRGPPARAYRALRRRGPSLRPTPTRPHLLSAGPYDGSRDAPPRAVRPGWCCPPPGADPEEVPSTLLGKPADGRPRRRTEPDDLQSPAHAISATPTHASRR
jgi:hypothetical protein